jgi:hypothetical protein
LLLHCRAGTSEVMRAIKVLQMLFTANQVNPAQQPQHAAGQLEE